MKILIACEFSGIVRDAFIARGHDVWSCDLLPTERPGPHIQRDVLTVLNGSWDMVIAFPPCTYLCASGNRWYADSSLRIEAYSFFLYFWRANSPRIAVENPIGYVNSRLSPTQIIQPWQFGHGEIKATCLWLKGLPKLSPTKIVDGRIARVHRLPPSPERWKERSRTFSGIAEAMAKQWG